MAPGLIWGNDRRLFLDLRVCHLGGVLGRAPPVRVIVFFSYGCCLGRFVRRRFHGNDCIVKLRFYGNKNANHLILTTPHT